MVFMIILQALKVFLRGHEPVTPKWEPKRLRKTAERYFLGSVFCSEDVKSSDHSEKSYSTFIVTAILRGLAEITGPVGVT